MSRYTPVPMTERLESRRLLSDAPASALTAPAAPLPARQVELLTRGVVAVNTGGGNVYVGWRLLATDPANVAFNLYRLTNGAAPVKRNASPITATTDFSDTGVDLTKSNGYFVRPVVNGVEGEASQAFTLPANSPARQYRSIPLQIPAGGVTPDAVAYTYSANDTSVGDLDGDGDYEFIVKWDPSNSKDNSQSGYTGNVYLDAYKYDGTRLWRIDLGRNIRAGAHYTQFMVYDLDGDGKAEVACKTADGTIDGAGRVIGNPSADYRNSSGYILSGPEYLTVFNGLTGAAMATVNYLPARGSVSSWGDSYGNRVDRFLAGVAYLDGQRPSLVMARGYYTRAVLVAWDWRDGQLTRRWTFDSNTPGNGAVAGQGSHSLTVADVDGDGKNEITYGAAAIDDNGTVLYSTGLGHGDALHTSDMDPSRPGLETFQVHETPSAYTKNGVAYGGDLRDARTGELLLAVPGSGDVGRGVAFDVDPRYPGYEMWNSASPNMYNVGGAITSTSRPGNYNFGVWWDADPLRELLNGETIDKWNWNTNRLDRQLTAYQTGADANNGTKSTPALSADLFGDWREEVVWRNTDSTALQIYTTTIPSTMRLFTLMHDVQYREAIAWQNVGYNQPPHPSFFLGSGMTMPPMPNVYVAGVSPDTTPPSVFSAVLTVAPSPARNRLTLKLDETVTGSFSAGDLTLTGGPSPSQATGVLFDMATNTVIFDLPTPLPNGAYVATLTAPNAKDLAGNPLRSYTYSFLLVNAGGTFALPPGRTTLAFDQFLLGAGATLDIGDNTLLIRYTPGSSPAASIDALLKSASNFGRWDGAGLRSSAAAGNTDRTTGIGLFDDGAGTVKVRATWYGDTNLDGSLTADDVAAVLLAIATNAPPLWSTGNFNYDTRISTDDLAMMHLAIAFSGGRTYPEAFPPPPNEGITRELLS